MPRLDEVRAEALSETRAALLSSAGASSPGAAEVPAALVERLARARAPLPPPPPPASPPSSSPASSAGAGAGDGAGGVRASAASPRIASVSFRCDASSSVGVRTRAPVLRLLARELLAAGDADEALAAAGGVAARLLSTGAYSRVGLSSEAAAQPGALDLFLDVTPRSWGLQAGTSQTLSGKIEAGVTLAAFDALGLAETIKLSALTSPGSLSGADVLSAVSAASSAAEPLAAAFARTGAALATPGKAYKAEFSAPTLGEEGGGGRRPAACPRPALPTTHHHPPPVQPHHLQATIWPPSTPMCAWSAT